MPILNSEDAAKFRKAAKKLTKKVTKTKKSAQEFLQKLGTHTKTGKLTKHYRD